MPADPRHGQAPTRFMPVSFCHPRSNQRRFKRVQTRAASALAALALAGCASTPVGPTFSGNGACRAPPPNPRAAYNRPYKVLGRTYAPLQNAAGYDVEGTASWYGWESGSTTSMGTAFNPRALTAASRDLPLPTCVEVTNLRNGRSAFVLVNDRGPFVDSRVMDLSFGAAKALGVTRTGTARVRIVALGPGTSMAVSDAPGSAPARSAPSPGSVQSPAALPEPDASAAVAPVLAPDIDVQPLAPIPAAPASAPLPAAAPSAPVPASLSDLIARLDAPEAVAPPGSAAAQTFLQLGAFSVEANARAQERRLASAGIASAVVVPGLSRGQPVYRVEIGPLDNAEASALQQRLRGLGLTTCTLVKR